MVTCCWLRNILQKGKFSIKPLLCQVLWVVYVSFSLSLQAYWKKMNQLLQTLNQKLATLSHGQEGIVKISAAVSDKLVAFKNKPPSIQREILSVCSDPYTLAQQLTHVELVSGNGSQLLQSQIGFLSPQLQSIPATTKNCLQCCISTAAGGRV